MAGVDLGMISIQYKREITDLLHCRTRDEGQVGAGADDVNVGSRHSIDDAPSLAPLNSSHVQP
eukprot:751026-Hanusia_phi.AAC.2